MIKTRAFLKWASLVILLLFFIPWLITFAIYFGAPFLAICGFSLSAFKGSPLSGSPQLASMLFAALIFLYYVFPFVCVIYFLKVCRVKTTNETPGFVWMILPFVVAIPLMLIVNFSMSIKQAVAVLIAPHAQLSSGAKVTTWTTAKPQKEGDSILNEPPHKSYLRTCIDCHTDKNILQCACQNKEDIYNETKLDLTTVKNKKLQIQNCNGYLMADVENCPS